MSSPYIIQKRGEKMYAMVIAYDGAGNVRSLITCASPFNAKRFNSRVGAESAADAVSDHTGSVWVVTKRKTGS